MSKPSRAEQLRQELAEVNCHNARFQMNERCVDLIVAECGTRWTHVQLMALVKKIRALHEG